MGAVVLAGCGPVGTDGTLSFLQAAERSDSPALPGTTLAGGRISVSGPQGYCIDATTLRRTPTGGFAAIASCNILTGGAEGPIVEPVLLTVSVSPFPGTAPTLAELEFPAMELYAMPAATQTLLDDSAVDIDAWIAHEVETAFAEQEGTAFVTGDGNKKPTGFLDYTQVAEASWAWSKIGYLATGVDGDFAATDPGDKLVDLVFALKAGYRGNAHFVMNRKTQGEVRKLKDGDGNYLWQPGHQAGVPPTLMGFPVTEAEDMPDIGSDTTPIAFGDFSRGYLVVDRIGTRILRDPYSAKPYVLFYTTRRVGGGVQDFDAIKLLKFGTS